MEKELERYDTKRVDIFKVLHDFEKSILFHFPDVDGQKFEDILSKHSESVMIEERTINKIKAIRNAFSHNKYPDPSIFLEEGDIVGIDGSGKGMFYTDYFYDFLVNWLSIKKV